MKPDTIEKLDRALDLIDDCLRQFDEIPWRDMKATSDAILEAREALQKEIPDVGHWCPTCDIVYRLRANAKKCPYGHDGLKVGFLERAFCWVRRNL